MDEQEEFEFRARAESESAGSQTTTTHQTYDPTEGMSGTQKFLAGAGKGMTDVYRGVKQLTGINKQATQGEIDESRKLDAPLSATGAGKAGQVVGQIAATAPAALIPGGGSVLGGAAVGAGLGAAQPVATGESRAQNAIGGAIGGAGGAVAGKALSKGIGLLAGKSTQAATTEAGKAIESGRVLPPSMAKTMGAKPGLITELLESVAGKTRVEQGASLKNESVNTSIIRKGLGLDEGNEITKEEVQGVRAEMGQHYEALKKIPGNFYPSVKEQRAFDTIANTVSRELTEKHPAIFRNTHIEEMVDGLKSQSYTTEEAVEISKKLRADGNLNYGSKDPGIKALAVAQKRSADIMDKLLDKQAKASGDPQLYANFVKARQTIAKSYDVEASITGKNKIDAVKLAKRGEKRPLSEELKDVAEFGRKFKGAARDTSKQGSRLGAEISKTELGTALVASSIGHHGAAAKAGLAALGPTVARKYVLSDLVQKGMVKKPVLQEIAGLGSVAGAAVGDQ
jgi:hypothetical protein